MNYLKYTNYLIIVIALPLCAFCCDKCRDYNPYPCIPVNAALSWDTLFTQNLDNSAETVIISSNDSIHKAAYGLRMQFVITPYSGQPYGGDTCLFLLPPDTIVNYKIYTVYDFDASHLAGSDLSDYFKIGISESGYYNSNDNGYSYTSFSTIPEYIADSTYNPLFGYIDFLLVKPPQLNMLHEFKVEVIGKNNTWLVPAKPVKLY
jgi:hypothetical protein